MPTDKDKIRQRQCEILEMLRTFSSAKLNDEYFALAEKLLDKMARKRHVPFETGRVEIWAAAIIHAIGTINFLFDPSQNPHVTVREIHDFFGTKDSSVSNRSKEIRDMFKLEHWSEEYLTREIWQKSPFRRMVVLPNGMIAMRPE
jgi:hypothetical protein